MAIWSDSPTMKAPKGTSAPMNTSVGSGSRPTPSRYKIDTSAPENAHTLGRNPGGALGVNATKSDAR